MRSVVICNFPKVHRWALCRSLMPRVEQPMSDMGVLMTRAWLRVVLREVGDPLWTISNLLIPCYSSFQCGQLQCKGSSPIAVQANCLTVFSVLCHTSICEHSLLIWMKLYTNSFPKNYPVLCETFLVHLRLYLNWTELRPILRLPSLTPVFALTLYIIVWLAHKLSIQSHKSFQLLL